jgi:SHS2 domain-containing protein
MFEFLPHTADIRVRVEADTQEDLFRDALFALCEFVKPAGEGESRERRIEVEAGNATDLLVDFLNEALWRIHSYREVYDSVAFDHCTKTSVDATLRGRAFETISEDIKAVTYHEANVTITPEGRWATQLVLDI